MARRRHLKKAPISEAVIDLRVALTTVADVNEIARYVRVNEPAYSRKKDLWLYEGRLEFKPDEDPITSQRKEHRGLRFETEDEKYVVQFRRDGFTFSRLAPYTNWETVFAEARRLWGRYVEVMSPEAVTRVAVRFINRLSLPLPLSLQEYLMCAPTVPDDVPGVASGFVTQITLLHEETGISMRITQKSEKSLEPGKTAILLDNDVFKVDEDGFGTDIDTLAGTFEQMRDLKNTIFFNSITEKTAEIYE